jgi:hypothetical protein
MHQKGSVPVFIVIAVVVVIAALFALGMNKSAPSPSASLSPSVVATPAPRPTPDVNFDESGKNKIYTNHTDNYTVHFPAKFKVVENPPYVDIVPENTSDPHVHILIQSKRSNPRYITFINEEQAKFTDAYNKSSLHTLVSGQKAYQFRTSRNGESGHEESLFTAFRYGIDGYSLDLTSDNLNDFNANQEAYSQILKTFTLLQPAATPVSKALQNFTDDKLGISFQYPGDWLVKTNSDDLVVYDEGDHEIVTLTSSTPSYNIACKHTYDKKQTYPLGATQVTFDMASECLNDTYVKVRTQSDKEMYFSFQFISIGQTNKEQDIQFLKTIKGIEIIK